MWTNKQVTRDKNNLENGSPIEQSRLCLRTVLWHLCIVCPRLSIYIRAYSLFVCSVAERPLPLFERRSHTWHNDLIPTGADNTSLISHYFSSDRSKVKRQSEGEMLHWTVTQNTGKAMIEVRSQVETATCRDGFLIQQTNWLEFVWVGRNFFHPPTFLCRLVIYTLQQFLIAEPILQQYAEHQICQPRV